MSDANGLCRSRSARTDSRRRCRSLQSIPPEAGRGRHRKRATGMGASGMGVTYVAFLKWRTLGILEEMTRLPHHVRAHA